MSNQGSDDRKPVSRFSRLIMAIQKSSGDSGFTKKDSDEPKIGVGGGRGRLLQLAKSSPASFVSGRGIMLQKLLPTMGDTGQPVRGRGILLAMLQMPTGGRGMILQSLLKSQQPSVTTEVPSLLLKRRESKKAEAAQFEEAPEDLVPEKRGTPKNALTNFIRLEVEPNKGVFEYEVRFDPPAHSNQLRFALLRQIVNKIGRTNTFDGVKLCLPIQLSDRVTRVKTNNLDDGAEAVITLIYKGHKKISECLQFYGILFRNIFEILTEPKIIPQHKLEIWPGYVTAVEKCYGGVM